MPGIWKLSIHDDDDDDNSNDEVEESSSKQKYSFSKIQPKVLSLNMYILKERMVWLVVVFFLILTRGHAHWF